MVVHVHTCPFVNGGDTRRVKNIDNYVVPKLSDLGSVEVFIYSIWRFWQFKKLPKFRLSENVKDKYEIPLLFNFAPLFNFISSLLVAFICMKYRAEYVIGEFSTSYRMLKLVKLFSPKTKIIIDVHGAVADEKKYVNAELSDIEYEKIKQLEVDSFEHADYIICQSDEMKRYISSLANVNLDKVAVYKCGVDVNLFRIDLEVRNNIRRELGLDGYLTFIYVGGMHAWQKMDSTLKIFDKFHQKYINSKFIVLTADQDVFFSIVNRENLTHLLPYIILKKVSYEEVPNYLNASDVAFLLRDDVIMNAVASPTKLAEYLACGLPVISNSVSKKWIKEEAYPFVLCADIERNLSESILKLSQHDNANLIRQYAVNNLSIEIDERNIDSIFL